jgi:hypothetical protein
MHNMMLCVFSKCSFFVFFCFIYFWILFQPVCPKQKDEIFFAQDVSEGVSLQKSPSKSLFLSPSELEKMSSPQKSKVIPAQEGVARSLRVSAILRMPDRHAWVIWVNHQKIYYRGQNQDVQDIRSADLPRTFDGGWSIVNVADDHVVFQNSQGCQKKIYVEQDSIPVEDFAPEPGFEAVSS